MGCGEPRTVSVTHEEAYVLYMQEKLKIHEVDISLAIQTLKKYSKEGVLTINTFALALHELGLLKLTDPTVDKEELKVKRREWYKFFGCLSDYRDESGETFNTLNLVMTFILLGNGTEKEKVKLLYENLDWQCRGYVPRNMIRLFIKNFCVVSGEVLPYYAEDTFAPTVELKGLRGLWIWAIERAPDFLVKKVARDWPRLNKEEFMSTFEGDKYQFLFNSVLLRRWMIKTYKEEFERQRSMTPSKPRLSIFRAEESPSPDVVVVKSPRVDLE